MTGGHSAVKDYLWPTDGAVVLWPHLRVRILHEDQISQGRAPLGHGFMTRFLPQ